MKLISFNIGIKIDNSKQVGDFIKSHAPDFVAFQEIIRNIDGSVYDMYKSQLHIKKIVGKELPYYFFGPLWITDAVRKNGKIHRNFNGYVEQGNEIISRFPIQKATNEHYYKKYSLELEWSDFHTEDHPRSIQIVEFYINNKTLQILNLHGIYSKDKKDSYRTLEQCKYILDVAKRKNVATIITGDFNLFPDTESIKILSKEFRNLINEYKIKSTRPNFNDGTDIGNNVVDYIFVSNNIKVNDFYVIDTNISDHLPLFLDFDLN